MSLLPAAAQGKEDPVPSLTLAAAHTLALKNHPRIAAVNSQALAAVQQVKEARAGFFPSASLVGTAAGAGSDNTRILAGALNNPSVIDRVAGGVWVSQLLTDFGRTANLAASAKYHAQAESDRAAATREQVLLEVDRAFFGALRAQAVLQVASETLDTRRLLLSQVAVLATNKLKSELDVSFAQVSVEEGRLLFERAQNDLDAARADLSAALGDRRERVYQPVESSAPAAGDPGEVSDWIARGLRDRPELGELRSEQESARRYARAQRDARLPVLAAVGAAGGAPVHDSRLADTYAAAGVTLNMPLFAGGLYQSRQREAELRAEAAGELLRTMEDEVIRDVRVSWLRWNGAREQLRTTGRLLEHAGRAFDLAQARYKVGSSSIVELSQAQLALTSAEIANTTARYEVLLQRAVLDFEAGVSDQDGTRFQPGVSQPQTSTRQNP
ncbi:MAG: TolC family protein [Verrucomicrobiota bacterium]